MSWTDQRVELLKKLWANGLSAQQIADELDGTTRNAVIGKVHRLKLSGRAKSPPRTPRSRKPRAPVLQAPNLFDKKAALALTLKEATEMEDMETLIPQGQRCTMLELNEDTCRWPVGDPADLFRRPEEFYFCGGKTLSVLPYCNYHSRCAYQPMSERPRRRSSRPPYR